MKCLTTPECDRIVCMWEICYQLFFFFSFLNRSNIRLRYFWRRHHATHKDTLRKKMRTRQNSACKQLNVAVTGVIWNRSRLFQAIEVVHLGNIITTKRRAIPSCYFNSFTTSKDLKNSSMLATRQISRMALRPVVQHVSVRCLASCIPSSSSRSSTRSSRSRRRKEGILAESMFRWNLID